MRQTSYDLREVLITKRIIPALGKYEIQKITPYKISKFYVELNEKGLSQEYIHSFHSVLRSAFKRAVKWQFISKNVMENVDAPKFERRDIVTWSMDKVRKFLDNVPADQYRIAFILALYTGMRRGEILGLRWKDVDLKTGKASIRQAPTKTKMGLIFQEPKTKNAKRQIALSQEVISALKKHKHWVNKNMVQYLNTKIMI